MNPLPRVHKQGNNYCPYSKVGTMREALSLSLSLSSEKGGFSNDGRMQDNSHLLFLKFWSEVQLLKVNRVIRKVRKTQHQNPEFCHTQGEIKKTCKKVHLHSLGMKLRKPLILVVN